MININNKKKNQEKSNMHNKYILITNHVNKYKNARNKNVNGETSLKLKLFPTNAAAVVDGKLSSLRSEVNETEANVVTIQEIHSKQKERIQLGKLHHKKKRKSSDNVTRGGPPPPHQLVTAWGCGADPPL